MHTQAQIARFDAYDDAPLSAPCPVARPSQRLVDERRLPDFCSGRALRPYQEESLAWMANNFRGGGAAGAWRPRNCILGDEVCVFCVVVRVFV
jgi:chromodomain-helicase-DNA-binding protein 7